MVSEMATAAVAYARAGWRIFPLHNPHGSACSCAKSDCSKVGKHPRVSNWQNAASCDEVTVSAWWYQCADANIGLLLDDLLVLDVDPRHGGMESLAVLEKEHGALDTRARQKSGSGGWHYLMEPPTAARCAVARGFRPGLDLLTGTGCYIVASPSLHASGGRYEWTNEPHPLSTRRDSIALPSPPQWLLDAAHARPIPPAADRVPIERLLTQGIEKVQTGSGRNDAGLWLFCQLRDNGYTRDEALLTMRDWVSRANEATPSQDRYTKTEAQASLKQAYRRAPRDAWKNAETEFSIKENDLYKGDVRICDPVEIIAYGSEGPTQGFRLLRLSDHDKKARELTLRADQLEGTKSEYVCLLLEAASGSR
jgi:hypothetical protein